MKTSNGFPQVGVDNVELTCDDATNDNIDNYEWQKDNTKIKSATAKTYRIPGNAKTDSGSYQCRVFTDNIPPSPLSDAKIITFLCKLYMVHPFRQKSYQTNRSDWNIFIRILSKSLI